MENVFVASCKRVAGKISREMERRQSRKIKTIQLSEGGEVVVWGLGALDLRAKEQESKVARLETSQYKTNMCQSYTLAVKTQTRDLVFESMLKSGEFTFDHMFLIRNPYGEAPLCALALFQTETECRVRVTTRGKTSATDYVATLPKTKFHRVPILGLYASYKNHVLIELLDDTDEIIATHTIPISTKSLPADLANCITVKKKAKDPAFPFVLINGGVDIRTCAYDKEGDIRYYLRRRPRGYGVFPLSDGHFFYMEAEIGTPSFSNPQSVISHDMDYMGRVYKTYLKTNGVHHTVEEKIGGNILAGSNTMLEHTEDMVIEIDKETGETVWSLEIWDLFDDKYKDMMDWCHVNSAAYYEKDRSVLISLRNIHSVICVDYDTKKLRWLLSDPEFWKGTAMTEYLLKPIGDVKWVYQQHAAYELEEDFDGNPDTKHIIVYDNHWAKRRKAESFDKDPNTYVTFFDVNEKDMTVTEYKKFASPKTRIRSNGIYVPEKRRVYNMAGSYAEKIGEDAGGVYEYDFDTGEVLSEYGVKPGFFRGYEFTPSPEKLSQPMGTNRDYLVGDMRCPVLVTKEGTQEIESKRLRAVTNSAVLYELQEDILMVRACDHQLEKIYLIGQKGCYEVDYEDTYQTMDIFSQMAYYHTAWLKDLPVDRYELCIKVNGKYCKTRKFIEKTHL